jgi:hypothetical protein
MMGQEVAYMVSGLGMGCAVDADVESTSGEVDARPLRR